jgi:hypothetical protein
MAVTLPYGDDSTQSFVNVVEYTDVVTIAGLTVCEAVVPFYFPAKHSHHSHVLP